LVAVEVEVEVDVEPEDPNAEGAIADDGTVASGSAAAASAEEKSVANDADTVASALPPPPVNNTAAGGEDTVAADGAAPGPEGAPGDEAQMPQKKIVKKKLLQTVEKQQLFMGLERMSNEMNELQTVFFVRCTDGDVPQSEGALEGFGKHFEFSMLCGDVLDGIANLLHHVYQPVIQKGLIEESKSDVQVDESMKHELRTNVVKFEQQLRHVVKQSRGDARLFIPSLVITNIEAAADDYDVVAEIESALEDWTMVVSMAVETELHKVGKRIKTPLGEIEFWRERNASLSALYEQISLPKVQQMLQVMKQIDNPQLSSFTYHFGELSKLYLEAKDNVKFLTTLERHFKHLHNGSFQVISESMNSMVNALRMVWVISRHFNSDERMAPLMETIAEMLAKRVREEVRLSEVLSMDFRKGKQLVQEAKDVLAQWSEQYFRTRKKLEDSSDHRWEFDRKALFGRTDYMGEICANILEILDALDHFKVFLGPELKAVTGDSAGIDEVLKRVEGLVVPLRVPFEEKIFSKEFEKPWESIMKKFRSSVAEIEKMTDKFIKESFRKLRSAEGAFELVQNFQKIGGGPDGSSIKQQINERYNDILEQYLRELDTVKQLFNAHSDRPPLYKNFPPVAGAIAWARDLYVRAKKPILRFKKHSGLLNDPLGEKVKAAYLEFARAVDNYITDLFNDWEAIVPPIVMEKLKLPVLRSIAAYTVPSKDAKNEKDGQFVLPPPPYRVHFSHELKMIITESRYLDKLGFRIPENALNVTLQDNEYRKVIRSLNFKLREYDTILGGLKPIEKQLLKQHIDQLNTTIKTGFYPLNWTSQRIPDYIRDLDTALVRFSVICGQVQKNAAMIEDIVSKIAVTQLLKEEDFVQKDGTWQALDLLEFYEITESHRVSRLESLVHEYISIGDSFLMKIEEIVTHSATGANPVMAGYYHYWEVCLYNAITQMIVRSMAALLGFIQCKDGPPLFKVLVTLHGKDFVVSPPMNEVDKILSKALRNMAESARMFWRWMHGTCIRCEPQVIHEDDDPFIFSFYQDISNNPQVINLSLTLASQTQRVRRIHDIYLAGWKRLQVYDKDEKTKETKDLWDPKRKQQIEKLRPTCSTLDEKMATFQYIKNIVDMHPVTKDIDFLQMDMVQVAAGISHQAELWKADIGEVLLTSSRAILTKLLEKISVLEQNIAAETSNLEELKFVLNVLAEIQQMTQDVELEMMDIIERYRTLTRFNIEISEDELSSAFGIEDRWRKLFIDSKTRDLRLSDTKQQFKQVTVEEEIDFRKSIDSLRAEFLDKGPGVSANTLDEGVELLADYKRRIAKLNKNKAELINAQNLFNLNVTSFPALQATQAEIDQFDKVYGFYVQFQEFQEAMSSTLWGDLDIGSLQRGSTDFLKNAAKFPKELKELSVYKRVVDKLNAFKDSLPLVVSLKNDAMKTRHWQKLMELTGVTFDVTLKSLTLSNIFAMELTRFGSGVEEIVSEATNEAKIENELAKIDAAWRANSLQVIKYKKDGQDRGYVLRPADDLKIELDDNMLNLQAISGSKFVGAFVDRVRKWEKTLNIVSECLDQWSTVQRKWVYLEGIFIGAEDIRQQLPEEAKRFDAIDKAYKAIMAATSKNPNVVDACTSDSRLDALNKLSDRLDTCQKSLSDYLNTKRGSFPRFYFMSDDDLLSVLGNSDPDTIQNHLLKLFDNVQQLQLGRSKKVVEGMSSVEKEGFPLRTPSAIDGPVEAWMTGVEAEMHRSLKDITKEGVFLYASNQRLEWLKIVLGMVGLVGSQIWWTWEVEDTFRQVLGGNKYAMKELESKLTQQLTDLVAMVRTKLDKITHKKVNTLLIIDVHARDIVDGFVRESVLNAKEFAWESQLRFYWDRDVDDCVIKQCTGKFRYGYEYMGLNGRLVITPLTDRCYMTLTQALTFKLGGSPAGPAGTGKTETTKDLAKSLALPCFVINCGDGLDYKAMASIFSGLVQVGAWGCFDEFNRINIEVLSVVSAQLRAIQNALLTDKPTCDIGAGDMLIRRVAGFATCGVFITMNPGYAGRTELPDNLKALFRPVTMIVPDFLQICEIMLFSEGFEMAKVLAKKMTVLYKLSKEQLSKQYHYDFGMRALKSVLVMAGGLKRKYQHMSEDIVLMRCLRDSNMPKFVFEDVPLFTGLINDLFPGLECARVGYEELKQAAAVDLESRGYRCNNEAVFTDQIDKVIQMYETQLVRHTTMIVGPTGGGKSLVLDTLKNAQLAADNVVVKMFVLNPKAQPLNELYGEMDPVTRDWTDGILSKLFRELNDVLPPGKENEVRWIVYDGDVDALWVENMNSVMDDNKLLTLPNGERIRLAPYCAMICETFDLQYASPATVSRCGMVWVDPKNLGYRPYYERWVKVRYAASETTFTVDPAKQPDADLMLALFDKYVTKSVDMILSGLVNGEMGKKLKQVITITNVDMVKQLCSVIDAFLPKDPSEKLDVLEIEMIYLFCIIWSLGAALVGSARTQFDAFLKSNARDVLPREVMGDGNGLLYDFFYDMKAHRWEKWQALVPDYVEPSPFRFYEVMVPTTDSELYSHLLRTLAPLRPILFVGESGTAKTTVIQKYISALPSSGYSKLNINFSSRTTAADLQNNIEANVDKRSGTIYGPPTGKKLIVFIDDLNMPRVDTYGTQQPIALLHFLVGRGTMYDRGKDLTLKQIKDLQYIGAMGPPGGGRNNVDTRFVALFNVFNLTPPTASVLNSIFNSIITTRCRDFSESIKAAALKVTGATLKLYLWIVEKMPPTPSKFHYIFNLRDISRVYEGVCGVTPDAVSTLPQFARLWRHECDRVFYDRLTTVEDQAAYNKEMTSILSSNFPEAAAGAMKDPALFGDFELAFERLSSGAEDARLYKDMGDYNGVRKIFSSVLEQFNADNKPMMLVLFEQALEHLCRIHRIIRLPRGNALLVGVGGSGKQSLTRLAAYCAGYKLFQITLCRGYGEENFKEDLKELYKQLGTGEVVFLFTDAHVVEEGFLEFLNNMLTTGMVPALYAQDEKDALCNTVRAEVKKMGLPETPDNLWAAYVSKCRNNLHIVLAMSPSGSKLRLRCRNFPGLVSNAVIDWFFPWPADALQKVADYFLADTPLPEEHRTSVVSHLVFTHQNVTSAAQRFADELRRYYYVTPKNYLDFIDNYKTQLTVNGKLISQSTKRLEGGLTKLIEAAAAVDRMQTVLTEKKIIVDEKTVNVQALIGVIQEKTKIASVQQEQATIKQKYAEEQAVVIAQQKMQADEALSEALPAVEAATEALNNLSRDSLTELKTFATPPPLVKALCLQLVCLKPTGEKLEEKWEDCRKMLGNNNLLALLKNFKKDEITDKQIKKVNKYFQEYEMSLEAMSKVSQAGYGLLVWVVAIVKYYEVARNVAPLRQKVKDMEKAQQQTERELNALQTQLKQLSKELGELNIQFEAAKSELDMLQQEAALMTKRLNAASKLIDGLTGERTRWSADVQMLEERSVKLVGDCLLGASFLSYLGAFTTDYRKDLIYDRFLVDINQRSIPLSKNFSLEGLLTTDAVVQGWVAKGLPADDHSVQNGILTTKGSRFPLCIDPQQQAVGWIKRTYADKNLTVKALTESDFMKHLELAIQFGNPFLFQNIDEELDPMLDPVLEKNSTLSSFVFHSTLLFMFFL
jgi:dynein heavy chain